MKIVVATPLYPPEIEELAIYTRNLAKYLQKDHKVTVLAYANQVENDANINIVTVNKNQLLFIRLFFYTWSLFKLAKDNDVIYVQNAMAAGLPAIVVKYLSRKPVVINFYEDEAWKRAVNLNLTNKSFEEFLQKPSKNKKIRRIIKIQTFVLRRATKIVVASKALAKVMAEAYKIPEENIVVNYRPEDRDQKIDFAMELISRQLFVNAPLIKWSGIEEIVKAIGRLRLEYKDIKLIISGEGVDKNKLLDLVKRLDLVDSIDVLGQISKAQQWYLFKTSQIYIHNFLDFDPIYNISKSWLAETVVIAKDTNFNRELLSDNQYGLLSNSDNLAHSIKEIFEDNILRKDFINKANKNLEERFSWKAHISNFNNIVDIVCKK